MATKIIKAQMKQRRDTLANWAAVNPVLLDGELGIVSDDPNLYKVGDGTTPWAELPFRGFDGTIVHTTGDSRNAVMSQAAVTEALKGAGNFNPSGTYPDLVAGDLAGHGESVPAEFTFRASGGKSIKDGRAYIKRIKGNSVVWNQKVKGFASWNLQGGTIEGNEAVWSAESRTGVLNAYSNTFAQHTTHKYLISADVKASSTNVGLGIYFMNSPLVKHTGSGNYESLAIITNGKGEGVDACYLSDTSTSGYGEIRAKNYRCIDLTQMFQAGNEPTTIEEYKARKPIVEDEDAYNAGEVIAFNGDAVKSVGDNAFDDSRDNFITDYDYNTPGDYSFMNEQDVYVGATRNGYAYWYNVEDYSKSGNGYSFRPTGGGYGLGMMVKALPNEEYSITWKSDKGQVSIGFYDSNKKVIDRIANTNTFVTPSNCEYILLVLCALDNHIGEQVVINDIMLTLVHSGWKQDTDAGYQPYWEDTLPLPIISKYFPQGMKKAGTAHDEVRFNKTSGKWEAVQRIGVLENIGQYIDNYKGNMNYDSEQSVNWLIGNLQGLVRIPSSNSIIGGLLCSKLVGRTANNTYSCIEGVSIESNGEIAIYDSEYHLVGDMNAVQSKYADTSLYYELAEPIVAEITEDFRDYYKVADFGTEMSQSSVPSAAFSADIIYQFNAVDMIREHELEITELQNVIATMQAQLASLTNN